MEFYFHYLLIVLCCWLYGIYANPPNIVFILTDDQDVQLGGMTPMEKTKKLLRREGMSFDNMFVTTPICCPSRSSIFTGKYQHNHLTLNNSIEGNCSSSSWQLTQEPQAFPVHLQTRGYHTFFAGKYLNMYGEPSAGGVSHVPPGWSSWVGLHSRAMEFLNKTTDSSPFFMMLSTPACHAPFTPAPQYADIYPDKIAPRSGSWNTYSQDKHWFMEQAITPMSDETIQHTDEIFRNRWRTLKSVDDMVSDVVDTLEKKGILDNTYVVFSSDNGYHIGQFSMPNDKRLPYDFDVRVPLIIRGPGVPPGSKNQDIVLNIDLAPTFVDLAGGQVPDYMDGKSLKTLLQPTKKVEAPFRTSFLTEYHGEGQPTAPECPQWDNQGMAFCLVWAQCVCEDSRNNTYNCVRKMEGDLDMKLCQFQDSENFEEMYDLSKDHYERMNIVRGHPEERNQLLQELQRLLACSGSSCD